MNIFLLILSLALVALLVFLFGKLKNEKEFREKIRVEDALKHIYTSNKENIPATLNSVKGHQRISDKAAVSLIKTLLDSNLARQKKSQLFLTEEGKKYALNIIKNHRLWERYLADESGLSEEKWHEEAEKMEHKLTEKERRELRKKLGNPLRDPHGDAIPSEEEDDFEIAGEQLSEIETTGKYKVVHVEDEPYEIYKEILNLQIYPQMPIEVIDINENNILIKTEHGALAVPKSVATNISVAKVETELLEGLEKLASLKVGESGIVVKLSERLRGVARRRLLDLGIIPGSKIKVMYENVSGNPRAYEIKNTLIALRNDIAEQIYVRKEENG